MSRRGALAAGLLLVAGLAAPAWAQQGPRIDTDRIFITCAGCHRPHGRGGGGYGGLAANLHTTLLDHQGLVQVITEGRPVLGMPSFKGVLSPEEIDAMATFVETRFKGQP